MSARDAILQNFWLKLFSLVLATMIWFAIFGAQNNLRPSQPTLRTVTRKIEHVRILVMKESIGMPTFRLDPAHIDLTVRGNIAEVQALTPRSFEVFIKLSEINDALIIGQAHKIVVHAPVGITIVEVSRTEARIERVTTD